MRLLCPPFFFRRIESEGSFLTESEVAKAKGFFFRRCSEADDDDDRCLEGADTCDFLLLALALAIIRIIININPIIFTDFILIFAAKQCSPLAGQRYLYYRRLLCRHITKEVG